MNARRFCLTALFALAAEIMPLLAAKPSESGEPFSTAAFNMPEATGQSFGGLAIGLGVGAVLGWALLSLCVTVQVRKHSKQLR